MKMVRAILLVCLISAVVMANQLTPCSQKLVWKNFKPVTGHADQILTGSAVTTTEPTYTQVVVPSSELNCKCVFKKRHAEIVQNLTNATEPLTVSQLKLRQIFTYLSEKCFGYACPSFDPSTAIESLQEKRNLTLPPIPIDRVILNVKAAQDETDRRLAYLTLVCEPRFKEKISKLNCLGDVPQRINDLLTKIQTRNANKDTKKRWRSSAFFCLNANCLSYSCDYYQKRVAELTEKINAAPKNPKGTLFTVEHVEKDCKGA